MDLRGKKIEEGYFNLVTIEGDNVASSGALQNGQGTNVGNISVGGLSFNNGDSELKLPTGTTAQRPSSPATGYLRYNTTINSLEYYDGSVWRKVADESVLDGFFFDYGTPAAAYSTRRIDPTYTGNLIKVRRSSDNTEQDIGFDSNGDLDETALLTFVGNTASDDGFVTTWYDQAGSNNATQATAASQPKIVSAGAVVKENGKPAIDFDGTDHMDTNYKVNGDGDVTLFIVATPTGDDDSFHSLLGETENTSDSYGYILFYNTEDAVQQFTYGHFQNVSGDYDEVQSSQKVRDTQYLITTIRDVDTDNELFIDGVSQGTTATDSTSNSTNNLRIGDDYRGESDRRYEGTFNEIIFYRADKSSDRTDIESNIATYFGITL